MTVDNSAQTGPIVSDERIRDTLRRQIERAYNVDRSFSRATLSSESGVSVHTLDQIMSRNPEKKRRVTMEDAFSIAQLLGDRAVSALLATIGYTARRMDEPDALQPMLIAATAMAHLSTIATAAADGRIDHTEQPGCQEAADMIIATVLPMSSAGRQGA
ncbi:hypothetical protein [Sphingomonas aerolata]|uniref:hypothetical protein n=1 Tax=Sphingomonas aerolata TaxID=185951 RepID=UPI001ABAD169|nr:hypothetical protein [Sphingomonas aerolata]NII59819.1 lambda repressor-like predicted transcriptional regulator [Sphingomonas aerolata]